MGSIFQVCLYHKSIVKDLPEIALSCSSNCRFFSTRRTGDRCVYAEGLCETSLTPVLCGKDLVPDVIAFATILNTPLLLAAFQKWRITIIFIKNKKPYVTAQSKQQERKKEGRQKK